jgi:cytochrome c-type biogenesis protein CcmF
LCGTATILLAIFYPLILEFFNQSISIGAPYFQATFVPLMVPLLFLMGLGSWFSWRENSLHDIIQKILPAFCLTASLILGGYYFADHPTPLLAIIGNAGALWVIIATGHLYIKTNKKSLSFYSMCLAHLGLGIAVLGMIESTIGEVELMPTLASGESVVMGQYKVTLEKIETVKGPNYNAQKAHLLLTKNGKNIATLQPEKRFYWTQKSIHSETAIYSTLLSHVYVAMGEEYNNGQWSFRFYFKPWINLLWLGVLLIIAGGALSAWNKRKALYLVLLLIFGSPVFATNAHEQLKDPHLEAVARDLDKTILCPVCSGQTLDSSMADMASAMRQDLREQLSKGRTKTQIIDAYVLRYGESIITKPSFSASTFILWVGPWALFVIITVMVLWHYALRRD